MVLRGNSEAQFELRGSAQGLVSNSEAHLLKSSQNSQTKRLRGFLEPLALTFIKAAIAFGLNLLGPPIFSIFDTKIITL